MVKIYIVGLLSGEPTPFDGQWVVDYDPARKGVDCEGRPMIAHLVTTSNPAEALGFETTAAAELYWKQAYGVRKDGRPNRPLTAFVVEFKSSGEPKDRFDSRLAHTAPRLSFVAEFFF